MPMIKRFSGFVKRNGRRVVTAAVFGGSLVAPHVARATETVWEPGATIGPAALAQAIGDKVTPYVTTGITTIAIWTAVGALVAAVIGRSVKRAKGH